MSRFIYLNQSNPLRVQLVTFIEVLPKYYEHLQNNPNSLIMKVFGLMRYTFSDGSKIYCIIFNNVLFNPYVSMDCIYDLKGMLGLADGKYYLYIGDSHARMLPSCHVPPC